jgi:hypothetical protein
MSFIAPLVFLGLAALAIPVLLHLIQREKKQILHFPSLMFVRQIPYKSVQRRRIHNWLLLMVRLAALALIVFAFARPFLARETNIVAGTGAREVVVLLDNSYSITYADRWERARQAAYDAINNIGAGDRGSIVLFSSGAEILIRNTAGTDRDALTAAVASSRPTALATRYAPALKVAASLLAESPLPRREVILISDFQRGGWRGEEGARLPAGATVTPVEIGGPLDTPNATLTAVSMARSTFSDQERVAVTAALVNRTNRAVTGGQLALEVGGRPVQTLPLDVEANGSTQVEFQPVTLGQGLRATVRIASDGLAADNAFNFIVTPAAPVNVIVVDPGGANGNALYLARALAIGDAPRFETSVRQPDALSDDDLSRAKVVILNDVVVSTGLGRRLQRFVEAGGGLLVAAGPRGIWPSEADILPGQIQGNVDRTTGEAARLAVLEFGHPVFEPFRAPRSGNFATARIYSYRTVLPAEGTQVLARFDSGAPALVNRAVGEGRVLLLSMTLDPRTSDLPMKAVFLPFIHQMARHLSAYAEPAPWLTVGQVMDASIGSSGEGRMIVTPSGRRMSVDDEGTEVMELAEQGFYEVRAQAGDELLTTVASNVDPAEADLAVMDPKEIVAAAMGGGAAEGAAAGGTVQLTPEAQERQQRLWWWLLVVGILLLGADTFISNRLSKT